MKNFILQAKAFYVLTTFLVVMFLGKINAQNIISSDLSVCYDCETNYVDFPTLMSQNGITPYLNNWKSKVGEPKYFFYEQIILKEEFAEAGGQNGSKINRLRLWINPGDSDPSTYGDWDVWIGYARSKTEDNISIRKLNGDNPWIEFTTPNDKTKMTKVYSGNIHGLPNPPTEGTWFEIPFSQEFVWNGTDHIVIAIHDKTNAIKDINSTSFKILTYRRPNNPSNGSQTGSVLDNLPRRFRTNERNRLHFTDNTSGQYAIVTDGSANLPTWVEPQPEVGTMPVRLNNLFQIQLLNDCPTEITGPTEIEAGTITKFSVDGESGGTWSVSGSASHTYNVDQSGDLVLTTTSTGNLVLRAVVRLLKM